MFFKNINYVYFVVITGNLLALTGDTTLTWSSPVLPKLHSNSSENPLGRRITETEESWLCSLLYVGALLGMLPSALLSDKIGRKNTLLLLAIPHITAYLIFAFSTVIELLYFGRILCGISLSAVYVVLPLYVAEISQDNYRGIMLVSYSIFASFGGLLPYVLGPYTSMMVFNLIIAAFPAIFLVLFVFIAPESPYYYVKTKQDDYAVKALIKLRSGYDHDKISYEIANIKDETQILKTRPENFLQVIRARHVIKGFIIALALGSFQQLSGISAVLSYTEIIFYEAGSNISAEISSIIMGLVLFISSFVTPFLVDLRGRKILLIISTTGLILSEAILGIYFYFKDFTTDDTSEFSFLPIICLVAYLVFFSIGLGPLPFTVASEILPSEVKFTVVTIAGIGCWTVSFLVDRFFLDLNWDLGRGESFFLFMLFGIASLIFVVVFVPETRGKSFQEIQKMLEK